MKIVVQDGLPFVTVSLSYRGRQIAVENVLLDTGSMGTIFSADKMDAIDLFPEDDDVLRRVRGIGGTEFVFTKQVELLTLGELQVKGFEIEVGAMEYGFNIDGIIGLDFLMKTKAIVDLSRLEIYQARA